MTRGHGFARHARPVPRLNLSLASPGFAVARVCQAGMVMVVVGAFIFAGWCWTESQAFEREGAQYAQSLARVQEMNQQFSAKMARDGLTFSEAELSGVYRKVNFANVLFEKRMFSWTRLLNDLEGALPPRVSIRSVRLNFTDSTVKLEGRVFTLRDLQALVNGLEHHRAFKSVKVSRHRFEAMQGEGSTRKTRARATVAGTVKNRIRHVVQFDLTVGYQPRAL